MPQDYPDKAVPATNDNSPNASHRTPNTPQMLQSYSQPEGFSGAYSYANQPRTTGSPSMTSVSWAPSCGRSYHLIATGYRGGQVRIPRVRPTPNAQPALYYEYGTRWSATVFADFD